MKSSIQAAYNDQYLDDMTAWREIGGKHKAGNILKVCGARKFGKVLECGAGEGSILKFLDASGAFTELNAIEISETGIKQIEQRNLRTLKEAKQFDGYKIPYPDKSFEMAYCSHVIEHVEHPRTLLREIGRVSEYQVFEVPLDYSSQVDRRVDHFLAYGHINIYTPSLFKFLLKSEGFTILDELLTHTHEDVVRFNLYRNMGMKKTFGRELSIRLHPFKKMLKLVRQRKNRFIENEYSAYTCLAKLDGRLKVF